MVGLTLVGSILSTGRNDLLGLVDIAVLQSPGRNYILTGGQATGAFQTYRFYADEIGTRRSAIEYSDVTGSSTLNDFQVLEFDGDYMILTAGRYEDTAGLVHLKVNGIFNGATAVNGTAPDYAQFSVLETLQFGDKRYVFAAKLGADTLETFRVEADLSFTAWRTEVDTDQMALGDIADFSTFKADGKTFLVAASAFDAGISVFQAGEAGNLRHRDTVLPSEKSGFDLVQDVVSVTVQDQNFVVMASAGTDSLTVFKASKHGQLTEVFHTMDTRDTRFQDASVLESFEQDGRAFVVAAGSDDGITIFEILPNGHLTLHTVLADDFDTTLANVSTLKIAELDGETILLVGSGSEHGITQFIIDTNSLGGVVEGSRERENLVGTPKNDVIYGYGKGDTLDGGDGNDVLDGGKGRDTLTGGAGNDIFIFAPDRRQDVITDFGNGQDRIDLSAFERTNHIEDLRVTPQPFGAVIWAEGEAIRVYSADGQKLMQDDFLLSDFIFL